MDTGASCGRFPGQAGNGQGEVGGLVLIVEADTPAREALVAAFRLTGMDALACDDADQALGLAGRRPDLVMIDAALPGVDGVELCRRLRARPEGRSAIVILTTGRAGPDERSLDIVRALEAGADDYMVKPFDVVQALARARAWLRVKTSREQLARAAEGAEKSLRESEARYRAMTEASFEGLGISEDGVILDANRQLGEMLGYAPAELVGRRVADFVAPEDREKVAEMERQGLRGAYEHAAVRKDGTRILLEARASAATVQCRPVRIAAVRDITEIRRAEEELRSQVSFSKAVIESAAEGLCVCHEVPEPPYVHFTVWNDRMTELTGYTMEEINRLGWYQTVYPDAETSRRAAERMARMRSGEDLHGEEWVIARADGQPRTLAISTSLIRSADGRAHALAVMQDVSDRKRMEEEQRRYAERLEAEVAARTREIRASEERHRALFESVGHAIVVTDRSGLVKACNPAAERAFGRTSAEMTGLDIRQAVCAGQDRPEFREVMAELDRTGTATHECAGLGADGREIPVHVSASTVRDRDGRAEEVVWVVADLSERRRLEQQAQRAQDYAEMVLRSCGAFGQLIGRGEEFKRIIAFVHDAARVSSPVLLQGESGTGKEAVARAVHAYSPRSAQPFVVVDCAALKGSLLESELFGHERGAFTGAHQVKRGLVEVAGGGTLFLDEIGEMPVALQAKLLRVLERGEYRRVGSVQDRRADIRVVAATNRDLAEECRRGGFRTDLFFRLNVLAFVIPPLRERREDVPILASHFLLHSRVTFTGRKRFRQDALEQLSAYRWPGNVRELANVVERAVILSGSEETLRPAHLPPEVRLAPAGAAAPAGGVRSLDEAEREAVRAALEATGGNRTKAARLLGTSTVTLRAKIRKYGLGRPKD